MKLIGLMSLESYKDEVRNVLERHGVRIYSEVEIIGHTAETLKQYGWWPTREADAIYSTLYFAIVPKEKADEVMSDIENLTELHDPTHPPRAFVVNVEKMV